MTKFLVISENAPIQDVYVLEQETDCKIAINVYHRNGRNKSLVANNVAVFDKSEFYGLTSQQQLRAIVRPYIGYKTLHVRESLKHVLSF